MRGNLTNLINGIPYTALQFYFYEFFKQKLTSDQTTFGIRIISGALAGTISGFITYPFDLIRTILSTNQGGECETMKCVIK